MYQPPRVVIEHAGASNPATEAPGWLLYPGSVGTTAAGTDTVDSVEYPYWELSSSGTQFYLYRHFVHSRTLQRDWEFRARLRLVTPATEFDNAAIAVYDGSRAWYVGIRDNGLYYYDSTWTATQIHAFAPDTGKYYELRLKGSGAGDSVSVLLDGVERGTLTAAGVPPVTERSVYFGDGTGGGGASVVRWNLVEFQKLLQGTVISIR